MSGDGVLLTGKDPGEAVVADMVETGVLLTVFGNGWQETQVHVPNDIMARRGEWLIERANQAGER
jgi:hypothetical protein